MGRGEVGQGNVPEAENLGKQKPFKSNRSEDVRGGDSDARKAK